MGHSINTLWEWKEDRKWIPHAKEYGWTHYISCIEWVRSDTTTISSGKKWYVFISVEQWNTTHNSIAVSINCTFAPCRMCNQPHNYSNPWINEMHNFSCIQSTRSICFVLIHCSIRLFFHKCDGKCPAENWGTALSLANVIQPTRNRCLSVAGNHRFLHGWYFKLYKGPCPALFREIREVDFIRRKRWWRKESRKSGYKWQSYVEERWQSIPLSHVGVILSSLLEDGGALERALLLFPTALRFWRCNWSFEGRNGFTMESRVEGVWSAHLSQLPLGNVSVWVQCRWNHGPHRAQQSEWLCHAVLPS